MTTLALAANDRHTTARFLRVFVLLAGIIFSLVIGTITIKVHEAYRFNGGDWQQAEAYVRHLQTQIDASQNLSMSAGRDITAMAASIKAGGDVSLDAGRSINLLAVEDSDHVESHSQSHGTFTDKTNDVVDDATRTQGTSIISGGNLSLNAEQGDITLYASSAQAGGTADVRAEGNLNILAGVNTTSHSEQSSKSSSATFNNHNEGFIEQSAAASSISSKGNLTLNAGNDINLVASSLHSDATLRIGDTVVDQTTILLPLPSGEGRGEGATNSSSVTTTLPHNLNIGTITLTNESWNETQKGFSGPLEEVIKVASVYAGFLASGFAAGQVEMPEINIGSHDNSRTKDVLQAGSTLSAHDLHIRVQDTAAFIGAEVAVQGTLAVNAKNIVIDAAAETHSSSHDVGTDTVKGLGAQLDTDKGEVRVAGMQESKTSTSDTQSLTQWRGTKINAGQLILNAENNIDILGSQLNVLGDAVVQAGGDLTIGGREGEVKQEHKESTETITVAAAVRNAYVDVGLAIKGLDTAKDALKDAKRAYDAASVKVGLGQLDASDLDFFKVNIVAATANLAQAAIAAATSLAAAAVIASSTAGTGMYATGSAQHDTVTSTSTSTQTVWQGSALNVGGNANLSAGATLKVQGSDVSVTNALVVDAKKIELIAGSERSTQSSNTSENHESVSVSASPASVGGSVNASLRNTDADSTSTHYVNTRIRAGSITSTSDVLRVAGAQVHAGDINIETNTLIVASLQDAATSKSQTRGASIGAGFGGGGVSSVSAGMEKSDSNSSSLWVNEQTQIIGSNSIKILAKDTTITGALIAHADVQGCTSAASAGCAGTAVLMDKGGLDFKTDTLVINDLHDISKSKTTGFSLSSSINTSAFSPPDKTNSNTATGQTTIGGQYYGHETQQITRATLGGGSIMVGGKNLTENNANESGLATLNRDVTKAQEITVDKDLGGLNASVTVDNRLFSKSGLASMGKDLSDAGKNVGIVSAALAVNGIYASTVIASVVTGEINQAGAAINKVTDAKNISSKDARLAKTINEVDAQRLNNTPELSARVDISLSPDEVNAGTRVRLTNDLTNEFGEKIVAAAGYATKSIYISTQGEVPLVDRVAHEGMHLNGAGEDMAGATGWLANAAFQLGNVLHQDAINTAGVYNFTALTQAVSQTNAHQFTVEQIMGKTDDWGSVGHQSTMAAALYGGGLSAEKAKDMGISAWAADTDARNAMSVTSLFTSSDAQASQQATHGLDEKTDPAVVEARRVLAAAMQGDSVAAIAQADAELTAATTAYKEAATQRALAAQVQATAELQAIVDKVNALEFGSRDYANYISSPEVQTTLHKFGDEFAHVNDEGMHYSSFFGHLWDSLSPSGKDPDDPSQHPEAYKAMTSAIYQAAVNSTNAPRLSAQEVNDMASKVISVPPVRGLIFGTDDKATTANQRSVLLNAVGDSVTKPTIVTAPEDEYGLLGIPHFMRWLKNGGSKP